MPPSVPRTASASDRPRLSGWSWWIGGLALVGLWLLARPYTGVRHDGILYLGQIYLQHRPDVFLNDLFFVFGSQDRFSVFSTLGAVAVDTIGLEAAQLITLGICHALLLVAVALLTRPLGSVPMRVAGLATMAVMPHFYGGMGIFSFAETFVTARTLAEPLAVGGLGALLAHRYALAGALLLSSALVHPLVALPVWAIAWLWLFSIDRRWMWPAPFVLATVVLSALLGVEPFDSLLKTYDPEWLAVVHASNPFVFPHKWVIGDWIAVAFQLGVLVVSARVLPRPLARLAGVTAAVAATMTVVSLVGASALHNILLTQLQLWRGLWLSQLLSLVFLPALLLSLWQRGPRWQPVAVGTAALALAATASWPSSWALVLLLIILVLAALPPGAHLSNGLQRFLWQSSIAALFAVTAAMLASKVMELAEKGLTLNPSIVLWVAVTTPLLSLGFVWFALSAWPRLARPRWVGGPLAFAVLILGIHEWDRRTERQRTFESVPAVQHPFTLMTNADSQVYWPDSLLTTWAMIHRASFFTAHQGSGVLFNRSTAMEYERRRNALAPLSFQKEVCAMLAGLRSDGQWADGCVPDNELVAELCRLESGPDYLVFPFSLGRGAVAQWTFGPTDESTVTYHLHDCALLR